MSDLVLLIDDDTRLVEALQIRLRATGYKTQTAFSGEEGIALARQSRPDVIVLDINMPGIDGYEVCRRVRSDPDLCSTPIIVLSAIGHDSARQATFQAGATRFMAKPYQASRLLAEIRELIDGRRAKGPVAVSNASSRKVAFQERAE